MKNFILLVAISVTSLSTWAQLKIPHIKHTSKYSKISSNSLVQSLVNEAEIVVMYRAYSSWKFDTPSRGIYYGKDQSWHYFAMVKKEGGRTIVPVLIPQDSIIMIWKAFLDNNIFELADEKREGDNCNDMVYDSQHLNFKIITKTKYKTLTYYDPEFFEEHCPGNEARKKIINCVKVIFSKYYRQKIN